MGITAENSRSTVFWMLYFTRMEQSYQNSSFGEASAPRQSITDGGYVSGRRYSEIDESTIQRPRIWPAFLAFILFPPVGFISFLLYKNAIDHIKYRRFDRFPEAETGFYNSVKISIALFSTIVGSYPYSHIQNWLSTNSTMNGTEILTKQNRVGKQKANHFGRPCTIDMY